MQYRGRFLHVQTEDSGRRRPHVVTQLFLDGNVLASIRSEYGDHLDAPDLDARIRQSMQGQHREMLKRLKRGEWDELIRPRSNSPSPIGLPDNPPGRARECPSKEIGLSPADETRRDVTR